MTCEWCKSPFAPKTSEQVYCKRTHATKANARRRRLRAELEALTHGPICPHPLKKSYSSPEQAAYAVWEASQPDMELYKCRCGAYHYGHKRHYGRK
jgi:hypothetical protein